MMHIRFPNIAKSVEKGWTFPDFDVMVLDVFGRQSVNRRRILSAVRKRPACAVRWAIISTRSDPEIQPRFIAAISNRNFEQRSDVAKCMTLDWQICSRARLSRDPRFDGKFFIGVIGSRVYCRPICPAPTAKEKNCRYFPTAAAAAEAGFRPCLRCRPESSPGTPAWLGTSNTVSRALRLIGESGLEDGVEGLAERLGVGSRHLRRLFLRHLGATPIAIAQTRRLHFAKKLIDETHLPMSQIALASGFGCVRRFNSGIRKVYHRTPTQIRRLARQTAVLPGNQDLVHLHFRPPYHWQGMLDFLSARATPGVEAVEAATYRRTIFLHGRAGYFEVSLDESRDALVVRITWLASRASPGVRLSSGIAMARCTLAGYFLYFS